MIARWGDSMILSKYAEITRHSVVNRAFRVSSKIFERLLDMVRLEQVFDTKWFASVKVSCAVFT